MRVIAPASAPASARPTAVPAPAPAVPHSVRGGRRRESRARRSCHTRRARPATCRREWRTGRPGQRGPTCARGGVNRALPVCCSPGVRGGPLWTPCAVCSPLGSAPQAPSLRSPAPRRRPPAPSRPARLWSQHGDPPSCPPGSPLRSAGRMGWKRHPRGQDCGRGRPQSIWVSFLGLIADPVAAGSEVLVTESLSTTK